MWKYIVQKTGKYIVLLLAATLVIYLILDLAPGDPAKVILGKPVIYLYPEEATEVSVELDVAGEMICTYPAYKDGWQVIAHPDGTLIDGEGKTYTCLFWEAEGENTFDFSKGFCIPGADTAAFLEESLTVLGLNARERNEFIIYWLPRMEGNPYNFIAFQNEAYTDQAELNITPQPDSLLRVFMAWKPLDKAVDIEPQEFTPFVRQGFTAVEWGGAEITNREQNAHIPQEYGHFCGLSTGFELST